MANEQQAATLAALASLRSSTGYPVLLSVADEILKEKERAVLSCEDEKKLARLQRKAQAAREFWEEVLAEITPASDTRDASQFVRVNMGK